MCCVTIGMRAFLITIGRICWNGLTSIAVKSENNGGSCGDLETCRRIERRKAAERLVY